MKRQNVVVFILLFIFTFLPFNTINAEPLNVLDCLDGDEDCIELEGSEEEQTDENERLEIEQFESGSLILNIVKMIFALLLVLVLIYVTIKLLSHRQRLNKRVQSLENLGGISVGNNKSIQVIRVGNKFYLIGVGDNVELLQEITDSDVIDTLQREADVSDDSISSLVTSLFPNKNRKNEQNTNQFKQQFEQELSKIKHHRKTLINQHTEKEDEHD